uniref:Uncharacterized protein n=1 Tax=Kalanchoe fedtschenkoi TaxID=63787 RepID=A0A7N0VKC9_KALFE
MLKRGQLSRPHTGLANVIRIFPTQAFNFAFKGYLFKSIIGCSKEKDGYTKWFIGNIALYLWNVWRGAL